MSCLTGSVRHGIPRTHVDRTAVAKPTREDARSLAAWYWQRPPCWECAMQQQIPRVRKDRTSVVDFHDEATYVGLLSQGKVFLDFVVAFILPIGFQLKHKPACAGGFCLTRHSHYIRVRLSGVTIWRYRAMKPDVAKQALLATYDGLSLELCAVLSHVSPMAIYRLVCAIARHGLVPVLRRCQLPLPRDLLVDETHTHCQKAKVYLPTIAQGRLLWHLGYTPAKSVQAFRHSYGLFRQAASQADPHYRVLEIFTDGFESTIHSMRTLFPKAAIGNCLLHAMTKVPTKLPASSTALCRQLSRRFAQVFDEVHKRAGQRVFALGQKLRRFTEYVGIVAGQAQRLRIHEWMTQKKPGWYAVYTNRQRPRTTTWVDRAHNALDRKLFMMQGFHHPHGTATNGRFSMDWHCCTT